MSVMYYIAETLLLKLWVLLRKRGNLKVLQNGYPASLELTNIYFESRFSQHGATGHAQTSRNRRPVLGRDGGKLFHGIQTGSDAHLAPFPISTGSALLAGKASGLQSSHLTSN
jgi:hypothetical protein